MTNEVEFKNKEHAKGWVLGASYWQNKRLALIDTKDYQFFISATIDNTCLLKEGEFTKVTPGSCVMVIENTPSLRSAYTFFPDGGEIHGPIRYKYIRHQEKIEVKKKTLLGGDEPYTLAECLCDPKVKKIFI
jgi:hypothetical protein